MSILKTFVALGLAIFAAAAWGADLVVERAASPLAAPEPAATDATMELKWDSGILQYHLLFNTGAGVVLLFTIRTNLAY